MIKKTIKNNKNTLFSTKLNVNGHQKSMALPWRVKSNYQFPLAQNSALLILPHLKGPGRDLRSNGKKLEPAGT